MAKRIEIYNMAGHLIRRLNQISTSVFQDRMKANGLDITSVQFAALNAIKSHPGIDQVSLAGLIAYDRATIGGVVDRLESKGLLERIVSKRDRRARELSLTPIGAKTLKDLSPIVQDLQSKILAGLSEAEAAEFLRLAAIVAKEGNELSRAPLKSARNTDDFG
jgi:MarR family transcriptional regulator, temperature-dependent positive regulator of motility